MASAAGRSPAPGASRTGTRTPQRPTVAPRPVPASAGRRTSPGSGRGSVTGRAALLAVVVAVLMVSFAYPVRTWLDQRSERADLEAERDRLASSVVELQTELDRLDDDAYVAALARERFGYQMPGEQTYIVPEDTVGDDAVVTDEDGLPPASEGPWFERLWTSVEVADDPPPAEPDDVDAP